MNTRNKVRSAMGSLYVIAILCAVFFGGHHHGSIVGAVAAIGALVVGLVDRLMVPSTPYGPRADRRAARRNRW